MSAATVASPHHDAILAYVAAFNARDMDGLAGLLADGVALIDWSMDVRGKAAVLEATRRIVSDGPKLRAELLGTISDGERVVADLSIRIDEAARLAVVDVFSFDAAGRITQIRAFRGPETDR